MIENYNKAESYGGTKERLRVMTLVALYVEKGSTSLHMTITIDPCFHMNLLCVD